MNIVRWISSGSSRQEKIRRVVTRVKTLSLFASEKSSAFSTHHHILDVDDDDGEDDVDVEKG
jgi:uncharacterized protein YaeQ